MANYTPNYRLHQWLPEDKFLRTDFNEDFSTIDAALGKTERSARRAVAGLERQGSDLYNLLLQNDYEGKTTGWKRALVFDGFQDEMCIRDRYHPADSRFLRCWSDSSFWKQSQRSVPVGPPP